ncbi:putative malate transporter YflS [Smittium mucronatum]|uniref:Putative malate transporter YflS n=1 Tax=Smittium mucronatum TaxID=133383 RepID=A0A1R0H227_9FUNG|nr:putative malate transporter YflS [Smittium mucronatum]
MNIVRDDGFVRNRQSSLDTPFILEDIDSDDLLHESSTRKKFTWVSYVTGKWKEYTIKHPVLNFSFAAIVTLSLLLVEVPEGLSRTSINLFAVFLGTIVAILTSGFPISIVVSISVCILSLTNNMMCSTSDGQRIDCHLCGKSISDASPFLTQQKYKCIPIESAFITSVSGFSSSIAWLVFAAFQIGKAVQITLLGKRIALHLISLTGSYSIYGLGYAICMAELVLCPFIPSNSARGGGIVFPIVESTILSMKLGTHDPVAAFLTMVGGHSNMVSSSLFLTAMAGNPIISQKASDIFEIEFGFISWVSGCFLPGIVVMCMVPLVAGYVYKPQYDMEHLREEIATQKLQLGPISAKEWRLVFVLVSCLILWAGSSLFQMSTTVVAFCAAFVLILMDVITWKDVLSNTSAVMGHILLAEYVLRTVATIVRAWNIWVYWENAIRSVEGNVAKRVGGNFGNSVLFQHVHVFVNNKPHYCPSGPVHGCSSVAGMQPVLVYIVDVELHHIIGIACTILLRVFGDICEFAAREAEGMV